MAVLTRECPGVDIDAAALVVTELAANVVLHAYPGADGPLEVDVQCDPDAATLTVRDWGRGFGHSPTARRGIGLGIVGGLGEDLRIRRSDCTEVQVRVSRDPSLTAPPA